MIVTDPKIKNLLLNNTVGRELIIHFPDSDIEDITNDNILSESMVLERTIVKEKELRFGGGIASQFKIKVFDIEKDLTGKSIEVSLKQTVRPLLYPSESLCPSESLYPCGGTETYEWRLFTGIIDTALRQKNRTVKEIIAFDDFYYNSKYAFEFMTSFSVYSPNANLGDLRDAIEYRLDHNDSDAINLFNDETALSMTLDNTKKAVQINKTTSTDVLKAYAELNASFAMMDRYNNLRYVQLLNPYVEDIHYYKNLEWEEFETAPITGVRFIYGGSNDLYYSYGYASDKPSVYESENILTKCCSNASELIKAFSQNGNNYLFNNVYKYRPYKAELFDYWWLEPGDKVSIHTGVEDTPIINSYVFGMKLTGVRDLKTTIFAEGKQYLGKDEMNGIQ